MRGGQSKFSVAVIVAVGTDRKLFRVIKDQRDYIRPAAVEIPGNERYRRVELVFLHLSQQTRVAHPTIGLNKPWIIDSEVRVFPRKMPSSVPSNRPGEHQVWRCPLRKHCRKIRDRLGRRKRSPWRLREEKDSNFSGYILNKDWEAIRTINDFRDWSKCRAAGGF